MNNFDDGAPIKPKDYLDKGLKLTPCRNKRPMVKDWTNEVITPKQWENEYKIKYFQMGLILDGIVDFDIDNHFIHRFAGKYLKSCGAIYGREGNPLSHYLFSNDDDSLKSFKFMFPKEFESYYKNFPHGSCICEIRTGKGFQSIVPGSKINNEDVRWNKFSGINPYAGHLKNDIAKIALSGALSMTYAPQGNHDNYCTAIAGVLAKYTKWTSEEIDEFVYNLALNSGDENAYKKMSKGTNAKKSTGNKLGMPTIAEIVGVPVSAIAKIFSWVGVEDSGSLFKELKVYNTEPKYFQLKYKDTWITIMDTSHLFSYTKMKVHILENSLEEPPEMTPQQWKAVRIDLLSNVKIIEVPLESSYMGVIGGVFIHWVQNNNGTGNRDRAGLKEDLAMWGHGCSKFEDHYWFRLDGLTAVLKRRNLSFEMRKLTHFLREEFGCVPTKISIRDVKDEISGKPLKELRVWKVPCSVIDNHDRSNQDLKGWVKITKERLSKLKYKPEIPY